MRCKARGNRAAQRAETACNDDHLSIHARPSFSFSAAPKIEAVAGSNRERQN
jgi:hypothetical protein